MPVEDYLKLLDGFAGFAALVNGILLWPVVRSLKADQADLRAIVKRILLSLRISAPKKPQRKLAAKKKK